MRETPNPETTTSRTTRGKKRSLLVAGVAAAVAVVSIGGPAAVRAISSDVPTAIESRPAQVDTTTIRGDVTLNDLADELAEMGLVVEITPADGPVPVVADGSEDTPRDDEGDTVGDDPFAAMTDEEIAALSDEEFSTLLEQAGWTIADDWNDEADPSGGEDDYDDDTETPIGAFPVNGDQIDTSNAPPEVGQQAQAIWERFVELIPVHQRQMVSSFELLSEDAGGGYVCPTEQDPTKWVLGIAPGLGGELDYVLIHEFGHLLTLQAKEVPPGENPGSCTTYFTGEGCARHGSTFARFVQSFWTQEMLDDVSRIQETGDWDAANAFYREHQDEFVTDYAATNPAEDLAETFTAFVMKERPGGDTTADQKVKFFWNDPAMTALRDQIRANLEALTTATN